MRLMVADQLRGNLSELRRQRLEPIPTLLAESDNHRGAGNVDARASASEWSSSHLWRHNHCGAEALGLQSPPFFGIASPRRYWPSAQRTHRPLSPINSALWRRFLSNYGRRRGASGWSGQAVEAPDPDGFGAGLQLHGAK